MLREEDIKLFPHNEKAYQNLLTGLNNYPLAFLEHATGTGKSMILLKYLYTKKINKRILFISMHDEMFNQLFFDQMPTLGINKSEFTTFDTMIYPNILKCNIKDLINQYDCFVFDEAHHCGAEKWGQKVLELKELVLKTPEKSMIGATATGTRYLDKYMDVSEIYFDGHTVSRLPISTSILNNLLPAPLYINSLASSLEYISKIEKKLSRLPNTPEIIVYKKRLECLKNKVEKENGISEFLKKYNVKPGEKYIVFCKDIKDLENKRKEAEQWFKDIGPIKTFAAHSNQKKSKNFSEIAEFSKKRQEISLMFAVDIFNEGFHIDGVDGVLMFRKTKSPIVYFQQIGRALSFSARRKQIKIFDFVNNIAESDIIYELYKEMISEARKLIKDNPDNKELYEEILSRFKIIDETTTIIDELKKIDAYINENYIVKNDLNNAINKLKEYRNFYPNTDFKKELLNSRLSPEYVRAYRYICQMEDYLDLEQIADLHRLNIDFNSNINLNLEKRVKLLEGCQTINELKEKQLQEFLNQYITFCQNNSRRPIKNNNESERYLYNKYRFYLEILSLSKLKKIINSFPFPPTIEESILLNNYPEKNKIYEYVNQLEEKITSGISLDPIEIKVLKKLQRLLNLNKAVILSYINNHNDINYKIEQAIITIENYKKEINPDETFHNMNTIIGEKKVYNAIKTIYKYAKRIINSQFEHLLRLNIKLPHCIDMTLATRLELLNGCNSFYELEKGYNTNIINEYIEFVIQNKRRPNIDIPKEKELVTKYNKFLKNTTTNKLKEICHTLKEYNLPLSFYEKAIIGENLSNKELKEFLTSISNKLKHDIKVTHEEMRVLRSLERHNYNVDETYLTNLINQVTSINKLNLFCEELESLYAKQKDNKFKTEENRLLRGIRENYKFITLSILEKLLLLNVEIPKALIDEIKSLDKSINIYDKENYEYSVFLSRYISYYKENGKRPISGSQLDKNYRFYLSRMSPQKVKSFINLLLKKRIDLTFEEKVLKGELSPVEKENYIKIIEDKIKSSIPLDDLEAKIYNRLKKSSNLTKKIKRATSPNSIEDRIVDNLRLCIEKSPELPINYNSTIYHISSINQRRLEQYRLNLLSKMLFETILKELKRTKKPLVECLTLEQLNKLEEYSKLSFLDEENQLLLHQIKTIDLDNKLLSRGLSRKNFIASYIEFISSKGRRPNIVTDSEKELQLALSYDEIKNSLSKSDFAKIELTIAKSTSEIEKKCFYDTYYNFIITNGRFPCGNSDNPEEVRLNNLYLSLNEEFTKEQATEIRKLKKRYSKATLQANLRFSKKN